MRPEAVILAFLGAALAIVLALATIFGLGQPDRVVWPSYMVLGLAAFVAGAAARAAIPLHERIVRTLVWVLGVVAVTGAVLEDVATGRSYVVLAIAVHAALVWSFGKAVDARARVEQLALIAIGWTVAATLAWFAPVPAVLFGSDSFVAVNVALLSLLLVFFAFDDRTRTAGARTPLAHLADPVLNLAAAAMFGVLSLRQDNLASPVSFFHWSFYVGPLELVRHGGWLLWDVPSQYGFLDILAAAVVPLRSAWSAFYVLDAVLLWLSALMLLAVLRTAFRGRLAFVLGFLVTLVAVYLIPGDYGRLSGPQFYPSIGAMRFIWVDAILALLALRYVQSGRRDAFAWTVGLGTAAWTIGVLWSAESAVYVSVAWLPAYVVMIVEDRRRAIGRWGLLALPAAALAFALAIVTVAYRAGLGHGPDVFAFVEFALRYGGGFGFYPISPAGAGWFLLAIFGAMVAGLTVVARAHERRPGALPAAVGAVAATWAIASYFVGRSADSNVTNISATSWLAIAVIALILEREGLAVARGFRLLLTGPIVVLLTVTLGNSAALDALGAGVERGYTLQARRLIPTLDPVRLRLFRSAQVRPGDPIVTNLAPNEPLVPAWPGAPDDAPGHWLPIAPPAMFGVLPPDRRSVYLARFTALAPMDGWFLTPRVEGDACRALDPQYRTARRYREGGWDLAWCRLTP